MKNQYDKVFIHDTNLPLLIRILIRLGIVFFDIWWCFLLKLSKIRNRKNRNPQYYFSICSIFKDEELSLKEWIEFHLLIGVDHFYLYNNFSSDNYKEILTPYIENGKVTLIEWPVSPPSQMPAYQHFYNNYWDETQWVAFIDLDEYICPKYKENIKDWIIDYESYPSVVVYWKQFGSSGQIEHDYSKLIIEQYCISWEKYYDYGKTFFNTRFPVYSFESKYLHEMASAYKFLGHYFLIPPINEFKKFVHFKCNRIGCFKDLKDFSIQINHYVTKSYVEFFESKKKRGTPTSTGEKQKLARSFYAYDFVQAYSTACDFTIYKFLVKLKIRMNKSIDNYTND